MLIVLPGALPSSPVSASLAARLPSIAPTLVAWMAQSRREIRPFDIRRNGCTPYEGWLLEQAGYAAQPGQPLGAALGPWRLSQALSALPENPPADRPVWLVDLVHLALGSEGATLLPPSALDPGREESAALFDAIHPLLEGDGIEAHMLTPQTWQIQVPKTWNCQHLGTPDMLAGQRMDILCPPRQLPQPWRRLLNEIQMTWHEHPVNLARAERGQTALNSLWLYGGTRYQSGNTPPQAATLFEDLLPAYTQGDWNTWIGQLEQLDHQLAPLSQELDVASGQPLTLVLTGSDRIVTLNRPARHGWRRWLPKPKHDWITWWSLPA